MGEYWLGIDLGTTYTAAAVARADGRVEVLGLGTRSPMIPSVVLVRADGEVLVGESADRRAATEPTRVAREFKRRLGDPNPLFLGGSPYSAEALMAHVLRHVLERALEREGGAPTRTVITHPASWSPFKTDLLRDAVRQARLGEAVLMTEPEAAALHYGASQRIAPGETVAVYDFGGGTFDAAVLTAAESGYSLTGTPEGIERLGGIDFDQAILAHVNAALGGAVSDLDPAEPDDAAALAALRDSCRAAKEALSDDTDATIAVNLPGRPPTQLRITRAEFEDLIAPRIDDTIDVLERTIESAGKTPADVARILPVGGTSRIPLVHQRIREVTGRPLSFDSDPNLAIAQGAAALARLLPSVAPPATGAAPLVPAAPAAPTTSSAPAGTGPVAPSAPAGPRSRLPLLAGVAAVVALGVIGFAVLGGGSGSGDGGDVAEAPADTEAIDNAETSTTPAPAVPASSSTTSSTAPSTTTSAPVAAEAVEVPVDGDRSVVFGAIRYTVDAVTIGNGVDDAGDPVFDSSATATGPTVVRVDLVAENTVEGSVFIDIPVLRLDGDPIDVEGAQAPGSHTTSLPAASGDRLRVDFELPDGAAVAADTLAGAVLVFDAPGLVADGIPLDGELPEPVAVSPVAVGAAVGVEGDAGGTLSIDAVSPSLESGTNLGSGYDEAGDHRVAVGEIWLFFDVRLDCVGLGGSVGCYFGLEEQVMRVEVDGFVEGFELGDWSISDLGVLTPGSSLSDTVRMRVAVGETYTLLLGDPADPTSVQRIPLAVVDGVSALYESVAAYAAD